MTAQEIVEYTAGYTATEHGGKESEVAQMFTELHLVN
jgi:hypothetical protein